MRLISDSTPNARADRAAALMRSGALGRRLVTMSHLAAAAHRVHVAGQIVREAQDSRGGWVRAQPSCVDGASA